MNPTILVYENPQQLAEAAARDFAEKAADYISRRGRFVVALTGGSTPKEAYELLAREYRDSVDWSNVHIFFGDERTVPPDSEDSNYRMANEALLKHVSPASVHRMRGELDPAQAAGDYEEDLKEFFGADRLPAFDLLHLGLGSNGHTASLFPNTPALNVTDRLAVENPVEEIDTVRLTLTAPVLNAANDIEFLVAGENKAEALEKVLESSADWRDYPAKMIRPEATWLVDRAAASMLDGTF